MRNNEYTRSDTFLIVLARDLSGILQKYREVQELGVPFIVVCGEARANANMIYRKPIGKFDAINFAVQFVPDKYSIIALNDVDTKIVNYDNALRFFDDPEVGLVITSVELPTGAHSMFNSLIDSIRRHLIIAANGELMFTRRDILHRITPLQPCKAEDSLILFKTLKLGYRAIFTSECYVLTSRTSALSLRNEQIFKRKSVCGIYQALSLGNAPVFLKLFYAILPFASPLLLLAGRKGWFWVVGIIEGIADFLKGDRTGYWLPTYK